MSLPVSSSDGLNWAEVSPVEGSRTTRMATFNVDGKNYTLTVGYNKQAIMDKYGVEVGGVDAKMEDIIDRMPTDTLKSLAGYTVSTSLDDLDNRTTYQPLGGGGDSVPFTSLKKDNLPLFNTIQSVMSVFKNSLPDLSSVPSNTGELVTIGVEQEKEEPRKRSNLASLLKVAIEDLDEEEFEQTWEPGADTIPCGEVSSLDTRSSSTRVVFERVDFDFADFSKNLSRKNPLKVDQEFLADVARYNDSDTEEIIDSIFNKIKGLENPNQKNEALLLITNVDNRDKLRKKLGLLKEGDVVCDFSQGKINGGRNACASICGEAILHLASGEKIESQADMENLLMTGIEKHASENTVIFSDVVFPKINESGVLLREEGVGEILYVLDEALKKDAYCVITCKGQTVLVHFDEDKKPVLFDSHGSKYQDADRGASNRKFNSLEGVHAHLVEKYGVEEEMSADLVRLNPNP